MEMTGGLVGGKQDKTVGGRRMELLQLMARKRDINRCPRSQSAVQNNESAKTERMMHAGEQLFQGLRPR